MIVSYLPQRTAQLMIREGVQQRLQIEFLAHGKWALSGGVLRQQMSKQIEN
jgi:hypothetical protein